MARAPDHLADPALEELYALEPTEFVARRNARAAALGRAGEKEAAAEVKAAPKPTASAWAVNQLVREEAPLVDELLKATVAVVRAQLASSGDAGLGYRAALGHRKDVERKVSQALRGIAKGEPVVQRAMASLRAGSLSEETRALIRQGRLSRDLELPDMDLLKGGLGPPSKAPPTKKRAPPERARKQPGGAKSQERRAVAERAARRAAQDRAQAREKETRATLVRARAELREIQQALRAAEARVRKAERAHTEAKSHLEEAHPRPRAR